MSDTLFIVEGPDGSGKTTLCNKIGEKFNISVQHFTYYKDAKKMLEQFVDGHEIMSLKDESIIFDRYIISNLVYGIVFHDCEFVNGWYFLLSSLLSKMSVRKDIHLIFCLPSDKKSWLERYEKLCQERDEMYIDVEKMSKVYDVFSLFYEMISYNTNIKVSIIDPFEQDLNTILNYAE